MCTGCKKSDPDTKKTTKELESLRKKNRLNNTGMQRAKLLMASLRLQGHTNNDICMMVHGRWSESTIKLYTRGIVPRKKGTFASRDSVANVLLPLISGELSLEDVRSAKSLKSVLDKHRLSIEDVPDIIEEASSLGINFEQLLLKHHNTDSSEASATDKVSDET